MTTLQGKCILWNGKNEDSFVKLDSPGIRFPFWCSGSCRQMVPTCLTGGTVFTHASSDSTAPVMLSFGTVEPVQVANNSCNVKQ